MERKREYMNEKEFLVLDNLYFVVAYIELQGNTKMEDDELKSVLWDLIQKGWANCFVDPETELEVTAEGFTENYV